MEEWPKDAVGLAASYTRILQAFHDVNTDAIHLPVGLVVSKADLLPGGSHLPPPEPGVPDHGGSEDGTGACRAQVPRGT